MKKFKVMITLIIMTLFICGLGSVKAADVVSGNKYAYTVTRYDTNSGAPIDVSDHGNGVLMFQSQGMTGTCIEIGVHADENGRGNATLTKLANTDLHAKIAYYWGVRQGYQNDVTNFKYRLFYRAMQYVDKPNDVMNKISGWSAAHQQELVSMVNIARNVAVPSTFSIYKGNPDDGMQEFAVWEYLPFSASKTYAADTPFGANNAAVVSGNTIKYNISWINNGFTSSSITDIISKGLTYVSGSASLGDPASQTKNSDGSTTLVWNNVSAVSGSLTYSVKVDDDICSLGINQVQNNAVMTTGGENYGLAQLKNPVPSKCYAPASEHDGYNNDVLVKGKVVKYRITLVNVKTETLTIAVSDVLSKGLTYNNDAVVSGGTLASTAEPLVNADTKTTALGYTVAVPAGQTAVLTYSATVNQDAVNFVNNKATANYGNGPLAIGDLNNPVPKKEYDVNTANGMNGRIVQKDDVITYNIGYSNGYLVPATVNLRDTLSEGLTYKAGSAKVCDLNKENCKSLEEKGVTEKVIVKTDGSTEIYWTRNNMPSLGVEIIVYDVVVTGKTVRVNNDFDIKICKGIEATTRTETITNCQEQLNPQCAPVCDPNTDKNCKQETDTECSSTKQECSITGLICSSPWKDIEELKNPVPEKKYAEDTLSGFNHTAVAKKDRIKYEIKYTNVADEKVIIKIKDTISNGIEYVRGTSKINGTSIDDPKISNKGKTLVWTRELDKDAVESLTYEVLVTGETTKVKNKACLTYDNNADYERCLKELINPVPRKTYAKNTKAGANGAVVKKNDVITYSIKYSNVKETASSVIIMDNISKGLQYVSGSAKINGKKLQPVSVTTNPNGTTLVWMKNVDAGKNEELTYDVKVTGETLLVQNNASIQYDRDPVINLDELKNPLVNNQNVVIPDTGSTIAIIGVIGGLALVGGGGYLIYRKYRKA